MMTKLADIVEQLTMEYASRIELSFDRRARKRNLRCNFCNRPFKYQMVLDEHVTTKHMADLKKLTDDERRDFLQKYIKDESRSNCGKQYTEICTHRIYHA